MKKENRKYWIGLVLCVAILMIVVIDYFYCRKIPDFIFLGDFTKDNVESYWQGVIAIFTICMTWLTIRQTADSYFFEKQSYRQIQKKEAVRHYQDLLRNAMDVFNERYDNENESLFAVQIVKNIIDLMLQVKEGKKTEDEIEPYQIISLDGALGILKSHLDKVLSKQRDCRNKRQDIELIIDILYRRTYYNWNREHLNDLNIYNFKDLLINIAYFDNMLLENVSFQEVTFCDEKGCHNWGMTKYCKFNKCIFECDFKFWWENYCTVEMEDCELQGLRIMSNYGMEDSKRKENRKNSLNLNNCRFEGYTNFSDNIFKALQISKCKFEAMLDMQGIYVESDFSVSDTEFMEGLDFQRSKIKHRLLFKNTKCMKLFYFGDSCLLNKDKIFFIDFWTGNFEVWNLAVDVYNHPCDELDGKNKQEFGDLFDAVWNEEKELYTVERKSSELIELMKLGNDKIVISNLNSEMKGR